MHSLFIKCIRYTAIMPNSSTPLIKHRNSPYTSAIYTACIVFFLLFISPSIFGIIIYYHDTNTTCITTAVNVDNTLIPLMMWLMIASLSNLLFTIITVSVLMTYVWSEDYQKNGYNPNNLCKYSNTKLAIALYELYPLALSIYGIAILCTTTCQLNYWLYVCCILNICCLLLPLVCVLLVALGFAVVIGGMMGCFVCMFSCIPDD